MGNANGRPIISELKPTQGTTKVAHKYAGIIKQFN